MGNKTLYVAPADEAAIAEADRLLAFHAGVSLSMFFASKCKEVVEKFTHGIVLPDEACYVVDAVGEVRAHMGGNKKLWGIKYPSGSWTPFTSLNQVEMQTFCAGLNTAYRVGRDSRNG